MHIGGTTGTLSVKGCSAFIESRITHDHSDGFSDV